MCLFITVLLPKDTNLEAVRPIWEKYLMDFHPRNTGPTFAKLRPNDKTYDHRLHEHCDCQTILGRAATGKSGKKARQKIINKARMETPEPYIREGGIKAKFKEQEGPKNDIPHWMGFLHEALEKDLVKHIGLFLHWGDFTEIKPPEGKKARKRYDSWKRGEIAFDPAWHKPVPIEIKDDRRIPLKDVSVDLLVGMEQDVLYEFVHE